MIDTVVSTCGLSEPVAQKILEHCAWNVNTTVERFFQDSDALFVEAGLPSTASASGAETPTAVRDRQRRVRRAAHIVCSVCDAKTADFAKLDSCEHEFCSGCWKQWFEIHINEGDIRALSCMAQGCRTPCSEQFLRPLVSESAYQKYLACSQREFVERNASIRYCIRPGCERVVSNPASWKNCRTCLCSCGMAFCFDCALPAHSPATCEMMRRWNSNEAWHTDQASTVWILKNTKDCPKCSIPIQKDRGCFLIACRRCRHQFCWLCCGDWSTHPDHFACAKFGDTGTKDEPEWRDQTLISDERVVKAKEARHYTMFQEHDRASKFETEAKGRIEKHLASLQDRTAEFYFYNVDFVRDAYAVMFAVRYFLKYTYVFSLFSVESPETLMFQHQQSQLERLAEKLSALLEPDANGEHKAFDTERVKSLSNLARSSLMKMSGQT